MSSSQKDKQLQAYINKDSKEHDKQPIIMWKKKTDQKGKQFWEMIPKFFYFFSSFLQDIQKLSKTVNKKWEQQQVDSYHEFLQAVKNYIESYILTGQVKDYNLFYQAFNLYAEKDNPAGKIFYDLQVAYLRKKQSGYDFILEKKLRKQKKKLNISQIQGELNSYIEKKQMRKIKMAEKSSNSDIFEVEQIQRSLSKMEIQQLQNDGFTKVERRQKQDKR